MSRWKYLHLQRNPLNSQFDIFLALSGKTSPAYSRRHCENLQFRQLCSQSSDLYIAAVTGAMPSYTDNHSNCEIKQAVIASCVMLSPGNAPDVRFLHKKGSECVWNQNVYMTTKGKKNKKQKSVLTMLPL